MDNTEQPTQPEHAGHAVGPGASTPRASHKYSKRSWDYDNLRWNYEYGTIPHSIHNDLPIPDPKDDFHTTTLPIPTEDHQLSPKDAYTKHKGIVTNTGKDHALDIPGLGKVNLKIEISKLGMPRYTISQLETDAKGRVKQVSLGSFKDFSDAELFLLREANTEKIHDKTGKMVALIYPTIGTATTEENIRRFRIDKESAPNKKTPGQITDVIPSDRPHIKPAWRVGKPSTQIKYFNIEVAPEFRHLFAFKPHEKALKVSNRKEALRMVGLRLNVEVLEPTEDEVDDYTPMDLFIRENLMDKFKTEATMSNAGRRTVRRYLDIPQEEKDKLINEVANQYYKLIFVAAASFVRDTRVKSGLGMDQEKGLAGTESAVDMLLTANDPDTRFPSPKEWYLDSINKKSSIKLGPNSPLYNILEASINTYGITGKPLGSKLAGRYGYYGKGVRLFGDLFSGFRRTMERSPETYTKYEVGGPSVNRGEAEGVGGAGTGKLNREIQNSVERESDPSPAGVWSAEDEFLSYLEGKEADNSNEPKPYIADEDEEDKEYTKFSNEPEDLETLDIPHDSSELASWYNSQILALNDLAEQVGKDPKRAVVLQQIYDGLRGARRRGGEGFTDVVKKVQGIMTDHGFGDHYVPVKPFLKNIVNKAFSFIKLDLMKAENPVEEPRDNTKPYPDTNPEYFTPNKKQLFRAVPKNTKPIWNPKYNGKDPQNMWAGKWFNHELGSDEYTYLHEDVSKNDKLHVHSKIASIAVRLKALRKYTSSHINSDALKDRATALALMLVDQGSMDISEVVSLTPEDVIPKEPLVEIKGKLLYLDNTSIAVIVELLKIAQPSIPIFSIPRDSFNNRRLLGQNYLIGTLTAIGVPYENLRMYQANHIFTKQTAKHLSDGQAFDNAAMASASQTTRQMGITEGDGPTDPEETYSFISGFIDPLLLSHIETNASSMGIETEGMDIEDLGNHVPLIQANFSDETEDEKVFNQFLRTLDIHNYL